MFKYMNADVMIQSWAIPVPTDPTNNNTLEPTYLPSFLHLQ